MRVGGGYNHRADLSSGVLIKDNHIALVGSVREAVRRARANAPQGLRVEVEVETMGDLDEALEAGAEIILLDNFATRGISEAVKARARSRAAHAAGAVGGRHAGSHARAGEDWRRYHLRRLAHALGTRRRPVDGGAPGDRRPVSRDGPIAPVLRQSRRHDERPGWRRCGRGCRRSGWGGGMCMSRRAGRRMIWRRSRRAGGRRRGR